jgi:hypothetical protein
MQVVQEDELVAKIHMQAEVFDPKTEYSFSYLQVSRCDHRHCLMQHLALALVSSVVLC